VKEDRAGKFGALHPPKRKLPIKNDVAQKEIFFMEYSLLKMVFSDVVPRC
jgi:hypothetical protein